MTTYKKEKEFIQKGFNQIASKYSLFNNLVSFGTHKSIKKKLAKKLINNLPEKKGRLLDICCGTGDIAFFLEKYASKEQEIIGIDFSQEMLKIARQKKSRVRFLSQDVLSLDYADNSITAVSVGFGLRNLVDLDCGLQEVYRVLKKGGIFCSLDMGKPTIPMIKKLFYFLFYFFVPKLGALLVKDTQIFHYFPQSTKDYPDAKGIKNKLTKIGFQQVTYQNFLLGTCTIHFAKK